MRDFIGLYLLMIDFQRNVREPLKRGEITDEGSVEIMLAVERLTLSCRRLRG